MQWLVDMVVVMAALWIKQKGIDMCDSRSMRSKPGPGLALLCAVKCSVRLAVDGRERSCPWAWKGNEAGAEAMDELMRDRAETSQTCQCSTNASNVFARLTRRPHSPRQRKGSERPSLELRDMR